MTDDERRRFESLETLRAAAYKSFRDRRGHEWKLSFGIWTALGILLAGLIQPIKQDETFLLQIPCAWTIFAFGGAVVVFLHAWWSQWASSANDIDNKIQRHFRDVMIASLSVPFSSELQTQIDNHPKTVGWYQISHLVQIGITALLAIAATLMVYIHSA